MLHEAEAGSKIANAKEIQHALKVIVAVILQFDAAFLGAVMDLDVGGEAITKLALDSADVGVELWLRWRAFLGFATFGTELLSEALGGDIDVVGATESKGLEFDDVVLLEPADMELGSLYVGLTRATRSLAIVHERPLPAVLADAPGLVVAPTQSVNDAT